jgi:hypothetical protein
MSSIFPGPTPPYTNPAIEPQFYSPRQRFISNLTLGTTTIVETSEDQEFVLGQQVRLLIPATAGSIELNQVLGYVINVISPTEVEVEINSNLGVSAFISNPNARQQPQIIPIGDINSGSINISGLNNQMTYIPGSFLNIS